MLQYNTIAVICISVFIVIRGYYCYKSIDYLKSYYNLDTIPINFTRNNFIRLKDNVYYIFGSSVQSLSSSYARKWKKNIVTIAESSIKDYYLENDYKRTYDENTKNSQYLRHPINLERRTSFNDIYLRLYHNKTNSRAISPLFIQNHKLEFYVGSTMVPQNYTSQESEDFNITIISQTSKERIQYIPALLERWKGPIAITVYCSNDCLVIRRHIAVSNYPSRLLLTLYMTDTSDPGCVQIRQPDNQFKCVPQKVYPINRLRNISIKRVYTSHFIVFDMDAFPAVDTYDELISLPWDYLQNPFFVTMVPLFAFSMQSIPQKLRSTPLVGLNQTIEKMPTSKTQLLNDFYKKDLISPGTHVYIVPEWYGRSSKTRLHYLKCFQSLFLEPYVMVKRSEHLPLFDEDFINYGFNKVQWIENLRYAGYEFYLAGQTFAVDVPHKSSSFAKDYQKQFGEKEVTMLDVYRSFLQKIREVPDRSRQLQCPITYVPMDTYRF